MIKSGSEEIQLRRTRLCTTLPSGSGSIDMSEPSLPKAAVQASGLRLFLDGEHLTAPIAA